MSAPNSSRIPKSSRSGNGIYPPHMQSSLSPQGFGLYNSGGGGDAMSILGPTSSTPSGLSPLKKETISYSDYLATTGSQQPQALITGDGNWRKATGNENFAAYTPTVGGDSARNSNGSYLNIANTSYSPVFDSGGGFKSIPNINGKALEKSLHQPQYQQRQYYENSNNSFSSTAEGAPAILSTRGNIGTEDNDMDRNRKKDLLIDSLSKSDMITCLPGFKKRASQFPKPVWADVLNRSRLNDKAVHHSNFQDIKQNGNPGSPLTTSGRRTVPHSSYTRQTPASLSPIRNDNEGRVWHVSGPPNYNPSANFFNAKIDKGGANTERRVSPPPSPISRAKVAVGRAQSEISKINSFVEEQEDRKRVPGTWKNMGTPAFSEPLTKSVQRQQKAQYRMDLERQILAGKMRKAEEERKERDNDDHPLGREYAHPALTYYNPPQKIMGGSGDPEDAHKTIPQGPAALTQYMKQKYSIEVPSGSNNATTASGYPQEVGGDGGTGAQGRIAPLQTKKAKALGNLMRSRMHPGDQHHANTSRLMHMNQVQAERQRFHNGMMTQPGNGPSFPQHQQPQAFGQTNLNRNQQQQHQPGYPPQYAYPPGTPASTNYQSRPYGMANAWPVPMYPAYTPYYGQPIYPNTNQGQLNSAQQAQQNYHAQHPHNFLQIQSMPAQSRSALMRYEDEDEDHESDIEFEALKEKTTKPQRIWQTSDELPDPGLRTAVYKVELQKQIDEDRKRKAERAAREKEEDERIERKIREFHEEERRRMEIEQQTRAELEGRFHRRNRMEKHRRKNEAFTIPKNSERMMEVDRRPRSRSSLLAEKLAQFGPEAGDYEEPVDVGDPFYNTFENAQKYPNLNNGLEGDEEILSFMSEVCEQPVRKSSPPVPVVQKKMIESFYTGETSENTTPRRQISAVGQNFLYQLKTKLSSERDLVERRLQEKLESTRKNMNLLKYTMSQNKLTR